MMAYGTRNSSHSPHVSSVIRRWNVGDIGVLTRVTDTCACGACGATGCGCRSCAARYSYHLGGFTQQRYCRDQQECESWHGQHRTGIHACRPDGQKSGQPCSKNNPPVKYLDPPALTSAHKQTTSLLVMTTAWATYKVSATHAMHSRAQPKDTPPSQPGADHPNGIRDSRPRHSCTATPTHGRNEHR